jgi:hypothetical protein
MFSNVGSRAGRRRQRRVTDKVDGLAPVLPDDATKFLNGLGAWTTPAGTTTPDPGLQESRLSAVTSVAIPTSDQTSVTELFLTPYHGNRYTTYSGSGSLWNQYSLSTDLTIYCTTPSNTFSYSSGTATVTMTSGDTSQLVPGMFPTGTMGTDFSTFHILKITGSTTFTMSGNASNTRVSQSSTLQLAAGMYDVFLIDNSGTPALRFSNVWTSTSARADALGTQDGVDVNNANIVMGSGGITSITAKQGKLIGSIYVNSQGSTQDADSGRYIVNLYNPKPHNLVFRTSTNTTSSSTTFAQLSSVQLSAVSIKGDDQVAWHGQCPVQDQNVTEVGIVSIGSAPTTEATNAICSEEYSGVSGADIINCPTWLDEYLPVGLTTRYLIGRTATGSLVVAFYGREATGTTEMTLRVTVQA